MNGEYWSELEAALEKLAETVAQAAKCFADYIASVINNDLPEFVQSLPKRKYPPYKTSKIKPLYLDKREKIHVCCRSNC